MAGIADYYNRTLVGDAVRQILFRGKKGLQSAELNEMQSILMREVNARFEVLQKEGGLIKGGAISIQGTTARITEGVAITRGFSTDLAAVELEIPLTGTVIIGIGSKLRLITENDDNKLLNPALGTKGYQQPGALRHLVIGRYVLESNVTVDEYFYPLYTIVDGYLQDRSSNKSDLTPFTTLLARYDSSSNGDYVVDGMQASYEFDDLDSGEYVVTIGKGTSHVNGFEIVFDHDKPFRIPHPLNIKSINGEPFTFLAATPKYNFRHKPVATITEILGTLEVTKDVVHGNYSGAVDSLPDNPVVSVSQVKQGATTYSEGVDFIVQGDDIDWSLGGAEPSPGSTYSVKYRYQANVTATVSEDRLSFVLDTPLAENTSFFVDYDYYIPRTDRVILLSSGELKLLQGIPDEYSPTPPDHSEGLSLATFRLTYGKTPVVYNDTLRAFKMSDIQQMESRMNKIENNIARLSLIENIRATDPSTIKKNLFVDPFYDDDQRDLGRTQNALIIDNTLVPNIDWTTLIASETKGGTFLPYTEEYTIRQEAQTGSRLVNEFAWLAGKPANISLSPSQYQWVDSTIFKTVWVTTVMRQWNGAWEAFWTDTSTETTRTVSSTERTSIPEVSLTVSGPGFNANESVSVTYDGRVIATGNANAQGAINITFTTPVDSKSGSKQVSVLGAESGVIGSQVFTAQPITRTVTQTKERISYDPVAQTFTPETTEYITSLEVIFAAKPVGSDVTVYITETKVGFPDRNSVIGQSVVAEAAVAIDVWTKFTFNKPVRLEGGKEYAIVVATTDTKSAVKIAKLGRYDNLAKRYVSQQAFESGVLLNSSNASTWSPIQDEDLTVKVSKAKFSNTLTKTLGTVNVVDATDLMLLCEQDVPPDTSVNYRFILTDRSNESYSTIPYGPVIIPNYTGRVDIEVTLTTSNQYISPVIGAVVQVAVGKVIIPSNYITRQFPVDGNAMKVLVELKEPSGASIVVEYWDKTLNSGAGGWVALTKQTAQAVPLGNGYVELPFTATGLSITDSNIQIRMNSSDNTKRPCVRNLRSMIS